MGGVSIGIGCVFLLCVMALWAKGARLARTHIELEAAMERNHAACLEEIGKVRRGAEFLEVCGQTTDDAIGRVLNRSLRSQAMRLLGSGLSPDSVASTLGVAKREVGLIDCISTVLARTSQEPR